MKNMKFRVNSPEHSEEIQRELFRLGWRWYPYKKLLLKNLNECYLYAYTWQGDKILGFGGSDRHFDEHENTETTLEELKAM